MTMNYTEYTIQLSTDPSYYGDTCSIDDAERIVAQLSELIRNEFPGIEIEVASEIGGKTTGPDEDICQDIHSWISDNWTAAL